MKLKINVAFILLSFKLTLTGQIYKPMPIDSATWGLQYVTQWNTNYNKEIIKGDTLLGGNTYHKTYSNTGALLGFYREFNKKVYAKVLNHPDTSEILLYDFNLNVGDTFYDKRTHSSQGTFFYKYKVTSITTSTATTDSRKQYYFNCVGYQGPANSYSNLGYACAYSWIEGIGSVKGLFNTRVSVEGLECFMAALAGGPTAYLVCFEHKNVQYMVQSCLTVGSIELRAKDEEVRIYPNPAGEYFDLSIANSELKKNLTILYIYNSFGQLVKEEEIVFKNTTARYYTNELSNGIYFVTIKSSGNETITKKLIIAD